MDALKMILFSLAVVGFFSWYANYIPQIESHPPRKISLDAGLSTDEMIEAGELVFNGKGTCNICHAIGRPGNRGPDLEDIGQRAAQRTPGVSAKAYLLEALLTPGAYLVEGYGALMPPMAAILSPGEILVAVAYLQSLGGEASITPQDVRSALSAIRPPVGGATSPVAVSSALPASGRAAAQSESAGRGDPAAGERLYQANCAPCHGPDPAVDGPVGPRIGGAAAALIEARVLRATYPKGYQPKRSTKLMQPMPHLEGQLQHLAAFLSAKE